MNFTYHFILYYEDMAFDFTFHLENVENGELQFITHGCRRSKHKCDKIS